MNDRRRRNEKQKRVTPPHSLWCGLDTEKLREYKKEELSCVGLSELSEGKGCVASLQN